MALVAVASAQGCDSKADSGAPIGASGSGGEAGSAGESGQGGSAGSAGQGGAGQAGSAGIPSWKQCDGPDQCQVVQKGCCGVCGEPQLSDVEGVGKSEPAKQAFRAFTCQDPNPTCPKCASVDVTSQVAFCQGGACQVLDVRQEALSACQSDADCRLRSPTCCEACQPEAFQLIALATSQLTSFTKEVCAKDQACGACAPVYPANASAVCGEDKHCRVVIQ